MSPIIISLLVDSNIILELNMKKINDTIDIGEFHARKVTQFLPRFEFKNTNLVMHPGGPDECCWRCRGSIYSKLDHIMKIEEEK